MFIMSMHVYYFYAIFLNREGYRHAKRLTMVASQWKAMHKHFLPLYTLVYFPIIILTDKIHDSLNFFSFLKSLFTTPIILKDLRVIPLR